MRTDTGRKYAVIFGINYPPEPSGIAPYTAATAEHLATTGIDVTAITAMPSYPAWRVYDEYRGKFRCRASEQAVDVRRCRGYVPARQSALRRAGYEGSFFLNSLTRGRLLRRPNVVVGVVPALAGAVAARVESMRQGCPYAVIVQDLMSAAARQSGIQGGGAVAGVVEAIERWALRDASRVLIISERFRPHIEKLGVPSENVVLARNWTHIPAPSVDPAVIRHRYGWPAEAQVVLHTGNMGLKQGLEQLLAAAGAALDGHHDFYFVLQGDGSEKLSLEQIVCRQGLTNVAFQPFVVAQEYGNVLAAADVLAICERPSLTDMSLPGKLTSYFAAGKPVVGAVPDRGATAEELRRVDAGIVVRPDDPAGFVAALLTLKRDPALRTRLGENGRRFATEKLSAAAGTGTIERSLAEIML